MIMNIQNNEFTVLSEIRDSNNVKVAYNILSNSNVYYNVPAAQVREMLSNGYKATNYKLTSDGKLIKMDEAQCKNQSLTDNPLVIIDTYFKRAKDRLNYFDCKRIYTSNDRLVYYLNIGHSLNGILAVQQISVDRTEIVDITRSLELDELLNSHVFEDLNGNYSLVFRNKDVYEVTKAINSFVEYREKSLNNNCYKLNKEIATKIIDRLHKNTNMSWQYSLYKNTINITAYVKLLENIKLSSGNFSETVDYNSMFSAYNISIRVDSGTKVMTVESRKLNGRYKIRQWKLLVDHIIEMMS